MNSFTHLFISKLSLTLMVLICSACGQKGGPVEVMFGAGAGSPSTHFWSFELVGDYTLDPTIDIVNGVCRLTPLDQTDDAFDTPGFASGSLAGVTWGEANTADPAYSSHQVLRLDQSGATNLSELDESWAPKWNDIQFYWKMNGTGNLSTSPFSTDKGSNTCQAFSSTDVLFNSNGKLNQNVNFANGTANSVNCQGSNVTSISNNISLGGWIKQASGTTPVAWQKFLYNGGVSDTGWNLGRWNATEDVQFIVGTSGGFNQYCSPVYPIFDGNWHYVVVTVGGGELKVYADGILQETCPFTIGTGLANNNPTFFFQGRTNSDGDTHLDDWAIWSNVLSAEDVQLIYSRQAPRYAGSFISRVMDAFDPSMIWSSLNWSSSLPFLKPLPDAACVSGTCLHSNSEEAAAYSSVYSDSLMNGIVGLWHLDETTWNGTADEVKDNSGNDFHGRILTGVTSGVGRFKSGAEFHETNSYSLDMIDMGDLAGADFGLSDFTVAAWVKTAASGLEQSIVSKRGSFCTHDNFWEMSLNASGYFEAQIDEDAAGTGFTWIQSTNPINDGKWHQVVMRRSGMNLELFVDGILSGSNSSGLVVNLNNSAALRIGGSEACSGEGGNSTFNGAIDEVAIWSRSLHPTEIHQLYRRGANLLKYQVRTCINSDCSEDLVGANWKGPDGTRYSYFSELNNNTAPLSGSGFFNKSPAQMLFSNFLGFNDFLDPNISHRYFQYRVVLESDDPGSGCDYGTGPSWCSPEIKMVSVGPEHFNPLAPAVISQQGAEFSSLKSFTQTLGASCASGLGYNLGVGADAASALWYWYNGSSWVLANGSVAESNDASTMDLQLASFKSQTSSGKVFLKAYLKSSGESSCELDGVLLGGRK